jgi:hypothetical protein
VSLRLPQLLQPLGKKKQDAALLATPLPRMTEDAVVAKPSSDAEKLELNKWIQERKASYPSTANLTAKQADADRCDRAHSWLFCHTTTTVHRHMSTHGMPAASWPIAPAEPPTATCLVRQAGSHRAAGRQGRAAAAAQGGGGAAARHGPRQGGVVAAGTSPKSLHHKCCRAAHCSAGSVWDPHPASCRGMLLGIFVGGHHLHVWRGGRQYWWQLHFAGAKWRRPGFQPGRARPRPLL